jgi:hypothetical protein
MAAIIRQRTKIKEARKPFKLPIRRFWQFPTAVRAACIPATAPGLRASALPIP